MLFLVIFWLFCYVMWEWDWLLNLWFLIQTENTRPQSFKATTEENEGRVLLSLVSCVTTWVACIHEASSPCKCKTIKLKIISDMQNYTLGQHCGWMNKSNQRWIVSLLFIKAGNLPALTFSRVDLGVCPSQKRSLGKNGLSFELKIPNS